MRLTVETGPLAGTVVPLDRAQPAVLGSGEDCAIRVQEPGVVPQHAVVKALKDSGFGVKALAPGLLLNGVAIEASPLQDGDVLELGTTRIAFGEVQRRGLPTIAGYRILEVLGRGGMGIVYRAEQTSLHREVALKVLNKELLRDPAFVGEFVAEARAAAKLQHPNVVHVFDVEHTDDLYYYAMELMHEGSLEDWLKQHGAMPVDRALQVVADAAAGLAYAESLGIVHRDIKPDNLMLDRHGAVKIADLGLARTEAGGDEKAVGTPHFMAPEQVLRKPLDHRTDLYALGCTFYRLITGRTPFRGTTVKDILRAQVKDAPEPPHKVNADVPAEVSALVLKLMEKDPADRFQTANELLEQLELLLQPPAKKGLWIGLATAAVVVAGGAIWWAVTKPKEVETVVVEKRYDDPEKQQFADEIVALKAAAREDAATIALLSARCAGLPDEELAVALDRVAAEHAGTRAATEASEHAAAVRAAASERARAAEQRRTAVGAHLTALGQSIQAPLQKGHYAEALAQLAQPAPEALRDAPELHAGIAALREQVLGAARERLTTLEQAMTRARDAKDDGALRAAADATAAAIAVPTDWPNELRPELDRLQAAVPAAQADARALAAAQTASAWQRYHTLFAGDTGIGRALARLEFAAAADAAAQFAASAELGDVADRARDFAAAARQAAAFPAALDAAAAPGALSLQLDDGTVGQVVRCDRAAGVLVLTDRQKRAANELQVPFARLSVEAWSTLAEQVPAADAGARDCFVGLLAVTAHADAARTFLQRLRPDDDASGTGDGAYPLAATIFEQLQRRLPEAATAPWVSGLRAELQAGLHLASGLRALSERRNLAAAGHIDRLLTEHPHSCVVALLP